MNRLKILGAFDSVPNVIEMARNKAESFPLDEANPKSIKLHKSIQELQWTLLRVLPPLIDKIVPKTFRTTRFHRRVARAHMLTMLPGRALGSPFGAWKIDKLLEAVQVSTKKVETYADSLLDEVILDHYTVSKGIAFQLQEVLRGQRDIQFAIGSAHGKNFLVDFLMEQMSEQSHSILGGLI